MMISVLSMYVCMCVQHATRRYNLKTLNGEFDVMLKIDGSDTVLDVKTKIAVRGMCRYRMGCV